MRRNDRNEAQATNDRMANVVYRMTESWMREKKRKQKKSTLDAVEKQKRQRTREYGNENEPKKILHGAI